MHFVIDKMDNSRIVAQLQKTVPAPPRGVQRGVAVEGNGTKTYVAVEREGQLVWTLKETTADLLESGPDGEVKPEQPVRVRLGPAAVFTANAFRCQCTMDAFPNYRQQRRRRFERSLVRSVRVYTCW
jgi:hypothetical protein